MPASSVSIFKKKSFSFKKLFVISQIESELDKYDPRRDSKLYQ